MAHKPSVALSLQKLLLRYEEIFTSIREELERSGAIHGLYHGVVLTGDACQIEGMVNLARRIWSVAHLGNPPYRFMPMTSTCQPCVRSMYATAAGLLMFSQSDFAGCGGEARRSK